MKQDCKYIPRLADSKLEFLLSSCGAVLIKGPKWCGKSTTAEHHMGSAVYMQDKERQKQNIELAKNSPSLLLKGDVPRLIDEWQIIPFIWDSIRYEVDCRDEFGQFILTGSSVPAETDEIEHSGAGRIVSMMLRTMSLFESGDSSGSISLKALFDGDTPEPCESSVNLEKYAFLICRGGWPKAVIQKDERIALQQSKNYYDVLINEDVHRLRKKRRDISKIDSFMRSYARNTANQASYRKIKTDMGENQSDEDTIASYIYDMERMYVIEELEAWNTNIRSKTASNAVKTRHFTDPSIGCAALHISPMDFFERPSDDGTVLRIHGDQRPQNLFRTSVWAHIPLSRPHRS